MASQLLLEKSARVRGLPFERSVIRGRLVYEIAVDVPVHDERRAATIVMPNTPAEEPVVHLDGPPCLRHRFVNDAVCMWWRADPTERRWVLSDGLGELATHIAVHAYCEAECRAGNPWPKEESPGKHPRKLQCPTCRGKGA